MKLTTYRWKKIVSIQAVYIFRDYSAGLRGAKFCWVGPERSFLWTASH